MWAHSGKCCHSSFYLSKSHHLKSHNSNSSKQLSGLCKNCSPPTFIFQKFSRVLSICGVSIQPVSTREPLLLSAQLCSVILSTSGGLPSVNLCGSTPDLPYMFKLLQETELLDLFIQLPRLRRDTRCLQPSPATWWLLWLVCINKKRQIISTNLFIKLTGRKTERD